MGRGNEGLVSAERLKALSKTVEHYARTERSHAPERTVEDLREAAELLRQFASKEIVHPEHAELWEAFQRLTTYTAQFDLGTQEGGPLAVADNIITGLKRLLAHSGRGHSVSDGSCSTKGPDAREEACRKYLGQFEQSELPSPGEAFHAGFDSGAKEVLSPARRALERIIGRYDGFTSAKEMVGWAKEALEEIKALGAEIGNG